MGSSGYRAPELMDSGRKRYTNKVDIWSMGCILYELATGRRAFEDDWEVLQYRYSGKSKNIVLEETFDSHSSETIANYVLEMLQIASSARPSASALSRHFFIQLFPGVHLSSAVLYSAVLRGDLVAVKMLLDAGADVNAQGELYGNALEVAADRGYKDVVHLLLENGADVNVQGGYYGNALQAASICRHEDVVRLLLENGAYVNAQGGYYGNALQAASIRGHEDVVRLLLENGAEVNAHGGVHGNALQAASICGHEDVVRLLLENGADLSAKGVYSNALQAASANSQSAVVQLLLENGAEY